MSKSRPMAPGVPRTPLPPTACRLVRALVPRAEQEEVIEELAAELARRHTSHGRRAARLWLWGQLVTSIPAFIRRGWHRGWTGFEPRASQFRPGGLMFESWIMDARYGARRLRSRPGFAVVAILTLALGTGGAAAVYSVAGGLLLEPLPIEAEQDVAMFWFDGSWTEQEFLHLRPEFSGFSRVGAFRPEGTTLEFPGEGLRMVDGLKTSAEFFDVLGAKPLIGRTFAPGDDLVNAAPVAVLSHSLWRDLGADRSIVGRQLQLGGAPRTVIGVMPPGFWFPNPAVRVWVAAAMSPDRRVGEYTLVGRLQPGLTLAGMQGPLAALADRLRGRFRYPPRWDKTTAPSLTPVRQAILGDVTPGLLATSAAVALILLMACVNVTTLVIGQMNRRTVELSLRAALGAERLRLMQQVTSEALIIGVVGGLAGAFFASAGFRLLVSALPLGALAETAQLDWRVLWIALVVSVAASLVVALISSVALWRSNLQRRLQATRTGGVSIAGGRLESALAIAQVAIAIMLSAGAGLLLRSVANLRAIDPGTDVARVAVVDVTAPAQMTPDERRRAYLAVLPAIRGLAGVEVASITQKAPLRGTGDDWGVRIVGRPDLEGVTSYVRVVSDDYFRTLGVAVRAGRAFEPSDRTAERRRVVINEAFAEKYFTGESPIGRFLNTGFDERGEEIIGVVANVAEANLTDGPVPARYMLYEHVGRAVLPQATYVMRARTHGEMASLVLAARDAIRREQPSLAISQTTTLEAIFDRAVGPAGQVVTLVSVLAVLALVLGAIGLYGVISQLVTRRLRDYGIYMALGLLPHQVRWQVVRRGVTLVIIGSALGLALAYALTGLIASLLYGVGTADPMALAGAVAALLVVGTLASWLPARRAGAADPAGLLREA